MTREEEIIETAKFIYNPSSGIPQSLSMRVGFIEGAKWADKHPSVDTIKKIVCYALRFTNIMLVDNLEEGVEWELLIQKAINEKGG